MKMQPPLETARKDRCHADLLWGLPLCSNFLPLQSIHFNFIRYSFLLPSDPPHIGPKVRIFRHHRWYDKGQWLTLSTWQTLIQVPQIIRRSQQHIEHVAHGWNVTWQENMIREQCSDSREFCLYHHFAAEGTTDGLTSELSECLNALLSSLLWESSWHKPPKEGVCWFRVWEDIVVPHGGGGPVSGARDGWSQCIWC